MTKVGWLSYADACNPNKDKEIENDLERQGNYYQADVYIQNPDNKRTLDELKTDDELLELLENLEEFAPVEIEVYEDHITNPLIFRHILIMKKIVKNVRRFILVVFMVLHPSAIGCIRL
jgi:hypothetical protein